MTAGDAAMLQPTEVLRTIDFWLERVKSKAKTINDQLTRQKNKLPEQLKVRIEFALSLLLLSWTFTYHMGRETPIPLSHGPRRRSCRATLRKRQPPIKRSCFMRMQPGSTTQASPSFLWPLAPPTSAESNPSRGSACADRVGRPVAACCHLSR